MIDALVGEALRAWAMTLASGGDADDAGAIAVSTLASEPWTAAAVAGLLRASRPARAPHDLGLTAQLRVREPRDSGVVARFAGGAIFPQLVIGHLGEPARELALRVAEAARGATTGTTRHALVLGGGVGTLALALEALGVPEIEVMEGDVHARSLHEALVPRAHLVTRPTRLADLVLAVPPYIAVATRAARAEGGLAYLLPSRQLDDEGGAAWRRALVTSHQVRGLEGPHLRSGSEAAWWVLSATMGGGPAAVLGHPAERVLGDPRVSIRRRD